MNKHIKGGLIRLSKLIETGTIEIEPSILNEVLSKMLMAPFCVEYYESQQLHGGTLGTVHLIAGIAVDKDGLKRPFKLVRKEQKIWERYGDPLSWRREYDLYKSKFKQYFNEDLQWPKCYHATLEEESMTLWLEYIEAVSANDLTIDMFEAASYELGKFQGRLYSEESSELSNISNLSEVDFQKKFYLHYRSWPEVYDYIRSDTCPLANELCQLIIDVDDIFDEIWSRITALPIVLCHRDFWNTNIFYKEGQIKLIDWDTTGWGYFGEDIASLIIDGTDPSMILEAYKRCIPAYYKGFSEYADAGVSEDYVYELMVIMFAYRIIEGYKFAEDEEERNLNLKALEILYEIKTNRA